MPDHIPANTLADQLTCDAIADIWAKLKEEAASGEPNAVARLAMFGPFAAERLGQRPKS